MEKRQAKPKFETPEEKEKFVDVLVDIFNNAANDYLAKIFDSAVLGTEAGNDRQYIGTTGDGSKLFIDKKERLLLYERIILNLIENMTEDSLSAHYTITKAKLSIEKFHSNEELFNKVFEDFKSIKD